MKIKSLISLLLMVVASSAWGATTTSVRLDAITNPTEIDESINGTTTFKFNSGSATSNKPFNILDQTSITGSSDTQQLVIVGNSTQTSNIVLMKKSDNTQLWVLNNSGNTTQAGTATISGGIVGVTSGSAAASGIVGEYILQQTNTLTSMTASTGAYQDCTATKLTLTAGDWIISLAADFQSQAAASLSTIDVCVGTAAGSSSTNCAGANYALNLVEFEFPTAISTGNDEVFTVPPYHVSISGSTDYYGKIAASFITTAPKYRCSISGLRVR